MLYPCTDIPRAILATTIISAATSQRIALSGGPAVTFSVGTKAVWVKFGSSTVAATTGTASEIYVPAESIVTLPAPGSATHVALIEAAATAVGSVSVLE
jgi:hypothetical protein